MIRELVQRLPLLREARRAWVNLRFPGSGRYWDARYEQGGTSGDGSYGDLAAFKAEVLNGFVAEHGVQSVIELGCGDGNQLTLARYPRYVGLDVSPQAIQRCIAAFASDTTKSFFLYDPHCFHDAAKVLQADCALSLDVIYHLVEDDVYERYLAHLFGAARRWVIVYSSDRDASGPLALRDAAHVRHRHVTADVTARFPAFRQIAHVPNRYPERTFASFFIYERA